MTQAPAQAAADATDAPATAVEGYPATYYAATANSAPPPTPLSGEADADVAIIGGGFTGVATALSMAERGHAVVVVEADRVGWGASGRNGGQFTDSIAGEATLRRQLGAEAEAFLWHLRWSGHELIEERVRRYAIACDLRHGHLRAAKKRRQVPGLRADYEALASRGLGDQVAWVEGAELRDWIGSEAYVAGLVNWRNGHLHPLNLCLGEAEAARSLGARIFEHSPVRRVEYGPRPAVVTDAGRVTADTVILAGNAYHELQQRALRGMLFPASSHIVVTEPLSDDCIRALNPHRLAVYDCNHIIDYYRVTPDNRLLFGAGCSYTGRDPADIDAAMRPLLAGVFPQLRDVRIDYRWGGRIGIVLNRVPQLGRISPHVWYAQGYSGHGICLTHIVGEALADAVDGDTARFEQFARIRHKRLPVGRTAGSAVVALGMLYYRLLDKF